jgi:hypothetical protein
MTGQYVIVRIDWQRPAKVTKAGSKLICAHPFVLKPGHFSGVNRGLERLEGITNFLNFSGD